MADWAPPRDDALMPGRVGFSAHIIAIRDLPGALARRAPGSPWLNAVGATDVLTASGSWRVPDGVYRIKVTALGGGGAGGAGIAEKVTSDWSGGVGGGGGAGAYVIESGLEVVPGESLEVIIGPGGQGGPGAGGYAGATSVTRPNGWTVLAHGGAGGAVGRSSGADGGAGGSATSSNQFPGARGEDGVVWSVNHVSKASSGSGAASAFGSGAPSVVYDSLGRPATVPGAGGSGGLAIDFNDTQTQSGGNGGPGLVTIEY